jgi:hypothetical protein
MTTVQMTNQMTEQEQATNSYLNKRHLLLTEDEKKMIVKFRQQKTLSNNSKPKSKTATVSKKKQTKQNRPSR